MIEKCQKKRLLSEIKTKARPLYHRQYGCAVSGHNLCFFASMDNVACGTAKSRSLEMSFPVTRHIPYVLFSIRTNALRRSRMNFSCRAANWALASLDIVSEPSSKGLKVGDVSSVPLPAWFKYVPRIISRSLSAFAILSSISALTPRVQHPNNVLLLHLTP